MQHRTAARIHHRPPSRHRATLLLFPRRAGNGVSTSSTPRALKSPPFPTSPASRRTSPGPPTANIWHSLRKPSASPALASRPPLRRRPALIPPAEGVVAVEADAELVPT